MDIDFDTAGTLTATRIAAMRHSALPDFTGTLRSCVRKAMEWLQDADPNIFLDRPVMGKIALGRSEIVELYKKLNGGG